MKKSNNFSDGEDYDKVCNIYTLRLQTQKKY